MPVIDRLESRFGRFAIPGLLQFIAVLQVVALVMFIFLPADAREAYLNTLKLDGAAILRGEVWRLFTYIFVPRSLSPVFGALAAIFLMWIGRALDEAWGHFRVNLYVLGGLIPQALAGLLWEGGAVNGWWLYTTTLFAMACIYPNEEILLMFILPVKVKWIAWLAAAYVVLTVVGTPVAMLAAVLAHLNFLIAFGPGFAKGRLHMAKVTQRRQRFETAQAPENTYFHKCHVCGKTDVDDPALDFRVTEEGDEICSKCRGLMSVS
ncbi:MAG TPA: hypothetical protein VD994_07930 [Prosthecobacter sp.]|nr:hypothetical protein [Prosthecobacter sp.]